VEQACGVTVESSAEAAEKEGTASGSAGDSVFRSRTSVSKFGMVILLQDELVVPSPYGER
jgi:hypothetical protein